MDRLVGILRTVVGVHHILGGERITVVVLHALAQVEDVFLAVIGHVPAAGRIGLGDEIGVDVGQSAEHVRGDLKLHDLVHARRIESHQLIDARPGGAQMAALFRGQGRGHAAGQQMRGGQGAGRGHQTQHGTAAQLVAAHLIAVQSE